MSDHLLGIDCGSTVTKAALFDLDGRELASRSRRTGTVNLANGGVERSPDGLWTSVVESVRSVISETAIDPRSVAAIGCAGHGNGLYALDARGQALPTAYQSLDARAESIVREWAAAGALDSLHEDAWQRLWAGQPLPILAWLQRYEPATYERIATVLLCKDYVDYRLTDRLVSEPTDMSAAGMLRNAQLSYNERLFDELGLGDLRPKLPELVSSTEVIGTLTPTAASELGLSQQTAVVAGLFDVAASAIGSGGAVDGCLSVVAGTWSINAVVTRQPLLDPSLLMTTAFADGERWMAIEASATSATNLNWFAAEVFGETDGAAVPQDVFERCCSAAEGTPLRLANPIYHPFLHGSPTDPMAKAGFYGLAAGHTRADLARAVLEGVAFGHRRHVDNLLHAGAVVDRVRLTGGGARSPFWSGIFADVLEMTVEVSDAAEAGARGAALAAGVGVGCYGDLDAAMAAGTRTARRHEPDPSSVAIHAHRYTIYRRLIEAMEPIWHTLGSMAD